MVAKLIFFFVSYIQIRLIIKTACLLEAFKPHLKIFEFKTKAPDLQGTGALGAFLLSYNELVILLYWQK